MTEHDHGHGDPVDYAEALAARFVDAHGAPEEDAIDLGALVGLFARDADARTRMAVARRAGLPYGEVARRWDHYDLLAEIAWDMLQTAEALARCPKCGTDPADTINPDTGAPLEYGRWKLFLDTCYVCGELERVDKNLRAQGDQIAGGTSWKLRPRRPGDPWIDDGGLLAPDDDGDD